MVHTGFARFAATPRIYENGVTAAARASRTSGFLLLPICGIHTPERLCSFPHRLLHATSTQGGWAMTFEEIWTKPSLCSSAGAPDLQHAQIALPAR